MGFKFAKKVKILRSEAPQNLSHDFVNLKAYDLQIHQNLELKSYGRYLCVSTHAV